MTGSGTPSFEGHYTGVDKPTNQASIQEREIEQTRYVQATMEKDAPQIEGWEEQLEVQRPRGRSAGSILAVVAFSLFVFLYVALGVVAAVLDNRQLYTQTYWPYSWTVYKAMTECISVAITLWPIGFGLIVYNTVRIVASYKAEQGTQLRTLEQMIGSRTFGSALFAPLSFRSIDATLATLLFVWLFSPIGNQALQRFFGQEDRPFPIDLALSYVDTTSPAGIFSSGGGSISNQPIISSLFLSAIASPNWTQAAPRDTWLNPKIPYIETLTNPDSEGWLMAPIGSDADKISFSSLLGVPIAGLQANQTNQYTLSNFTMEASYFHLTCAPFTDKTRNVTTGDNTTASEGSLAVGCIENACVPNGDVDGGTGGTLFLGYEDTKQRFAYASRSKADDSTAYAYTECDYDVTHVEARVYCAGKQCTATHLRKLPAIKQQEGFEYILPRNFFAMFAKASFNAQIGSVSVTEQFLWDPRIVLSNGRFTDIHNMGDLSLSTFTERLGRLINTYWMAGYNPVQTTSSLPPVFPTTGEDANFAGPKNITAKANVMEPVYACYWPWLAVLLFSCALVAAVIVVGAVLEPKILGPDIMGYVSSITRNNPYTPLPRGGSTLDGMQRARLVGHVKVRMQDVQGQEDVGHVALSSVEGAPLQRGRKYW